MNGINVGAEITMETAAMLLGRSRTYVYTQQRKGVLPNPITVGSVLQLLDADLEAEQRRNEDGKEKAQRLFPK